MRHQRGDGPGGLPPASDATRIRWKVSKPAGCRSSRFGVRRRRSGPSEPRRSGGGFRAGSIAMSGNDLLGHLGQLLQVRSVRMISPTPVSTRWGMSIRAYILYVQ